MKRALTVKDVMSKSYNIMNFKGKWLASFGQPELSGSWIIWGESGNGKTRFTLQLAKYLTRFGRVAYNSLEEGSRLSMKLAIEATRLSDVQHAFLLLEKDSTAELSARLAKRRSPSIVIIDSLQYSGLTRDSYKKLLNQFPDKLFVLVSHADGKNPLGSLANAIRYDADVKIRIEGYRAFITSRLGGGKPFTIWEDGAMSYWGDQPQNNHHAQ